MGEKIEEMAKLVQQDMCGDIPCEECNYHGKMKILPRYCGTYLIAEKLFNAGYRKREETIKEVFTWLPQALRELYASGKWVEWKDLAEKVKEKFGVEIKYD